MLKRKYRLNFKTKPRFLKSINLPSFTLRIAKNGLPYNRYGFIVSKKTEKRAVVRNKAKRMFNGCIESFLKEIKNGYDMGFFIKKNALGISKNKVCLLIKDVFTKEGFLK